MDILQTLKREHEQVNNLLEKMMESGDAAVKTREALLVKLKELIIPHAKAEQKTLYARLNKNEEAVDMVDEAIEEHEEVEELLSKLEDLDVTSEEWMDTLEELKDNVDHHVEEEETEMFEQAKKMFDEEELEEIAREYGREKEAVKV